MAKLLVTVGFVSLFVLGCQNFDSELSHKKKRGDTDDYVPRISQKVSGLKKESGVLECVGVTETSYFVRSRSEFTKGQLTSHKIDAFRNSVTPDRVPNQLTPNLNDYLAFSDELVQDGAEFEIDLDGKKFSIEVFSGNQRKDQKIYDLDISVGPDGEGGFLLNGYLSYKQPSVQIDLSELYMSCAVLDKLK